MCVDCRCLSQVSDLEKSLNPEPAGVKGLFKEAFDLLLDLVKKDERERSEPAQSSGGSLLFVSVDLHVIAALNRAMAWCFDGFSLSWALRNLAYNNETTKTKIGKRQGIDACHGSG